MIGRRRRLPVVVVVLAVLGAVGCRATSSSDHGAAGPGSSGSSIPPVATGPLQYRITDDGFDGPSRVTTGVVRLEVLNATANYHHLSVARIDRGSTPEDIATAAATGDSETIEAITTAVGGVNVLDPGRTGAAEVTFDQPGEHVLLCFMTDPDGTSHLMAGMVAPLTVVPGPPPTASPAASPGEDPVPRITMSDFAYELDEASLQGRSRITFQSTGTQDHEAIVVRLDPGKQATDLLAYFAARLEGQDLPLSEAPGEAIGGPGALAPGRSSTVDLDLTPGSYVVFCAVPDPHRSGAPHVMAGMLDTFTIG